MKMLQRFFCVICSLLIISFFSPKAVARNTDKAPEYFQLKVYHFSSTQQEIAIDNYLKNIFIPAMHANNITNIGVFKFIGNDTAADKKLYVFIPFKNIKEWEKYFVQSREMPISGDTDYVNSNNIRLAYNRIESIFIHAFKKMQAITPSKLTGPKAERIYELRSYESAGEKNYAAKVHMFNEGGETVIFSRLGFNAVFYGDVIFGSKTPNLMYMTSFENMNARTEHWKAFSNDPEWKTLSGMQEYQKVVSKSEIVFLYLTEYSDL